MDYLNTTSRKRRVLGSAMIFGGRFWALRKWLLSCFGVLLLFSVVLPGAACGMVARIQDVLITPQSGQILVYARVTNCFTKDMESAIMAGVPTTFTFVMDLYEERSMWVDRKIITATIKHTIKFDSVKKIFYVTSSMGRESTSFQDLDNAKRAMSEFNGAIPLAGYPYKNGRYYVMMKAKLDKVRLPLYMDYIFFFVSLWDFETAWYRQPVLF